MATKKQTTKAKWVLVTDKSRDIFYGKVDAAKIDADVVVLTEARRVFYWSANNGARGIDSLATIGPQMGSKIGPLVSEIRVRDVAAVVECSPESRKAWEGATWA